MDWPQLVANYGLVTILVAGSLYFILKRVLGKSIDASIDLIKEKEIGMFKSHIDQELEELKHQFEFERVKTSLFSKIQREAFTEILSELGSVIDALNKAFDESSEMPHAINASHLDRFRLTYNKHLLYLDKQTLNSLALCLDSVWKATSAPINTPEDEPSVEKVDEAFAELHYLIPKIAELFRVKLGLSQNTKPCTEIAILGAVIVLNRYHFKSIDLPIKGTFERNKFRQIEELVTTGRENLDELLKLVEVLLEYVQTEAQLFYHLVPKLEFYLSELKKEIANI